MKKTVKQLQAEIDVLQHDFSCLVEVNESLKRDLNGNREQTVKQKENDQLKLFVRAIKSCPLPWTAGIGASHHELDGKLITFSMPLGWLNGVADIIERRLTR